MKLLLPGVSYEVAVIGRGRADDHLRRLRRHARDRLWVQIIKAVLLMSGSLLLSILVMSHFGFSFAKFF